MHSSFVCHLYVTRMYSYVISMSLYELVCHPYAIHMYSYVTRMSFACTRMWFYHEPFGRRKFKFIR